MFRERRPWPTIVHLLAWAIALAFILGGAFVFYLFALDMGNEEMKPFTVSMIFALVSVIFLIHPPVVSVSRHKRLQV